MIWHQTPESQGQMVEVFLGIDHDHFDGVVMMITDRTEPHEPPQYYYYKWDYPEDPDWQPWDGEFGDDSDWVQITDPKDIAELEAS